MGQKISVIIPAFNEEKNIKSTVIAVHETKQVGEIIVVDDGSYDNTSDVALEAGALVCRHKDNKGKAEAIKTGVMLASHPVLAFLDADLKKTAALADTLVAPVLDDTADMTVAVLPKPKKRGFGLVKKTASYYIKQQTGVLFIEPLSGQRGLKKEVWDFIKPKKTHGFGLEIAMSLNALRKGFRVMEIPLAFYHRERGKDISSFIHRGKQFGAVMKVILGDLFDDL